MAIFTGNLLVDSAAVVVALLTILVVYYKWTFSYWKRLGVYAAPPSIPFGNAANLMLQKISLGVEMQHVYADLKSKGKPYGGYYFLGKPIFVPTDLDLIKQIMTKDFGHFTDHVNHVDEKVDPLSGHLFSLKGSKWKNLRVKLTPTFTSGKMKMMFQTLLNCSDGLVDVVDQTLEAREAVDIKDVVARFTTDIIGSCAFGLECNSLKDANSEFREYGKKVFESSLTEGFYRLLALTVPDFFKYLKLRVFRKDVSDFFVNIVQQTVNFREQNNIMRKDFMHLLIQLKNGVKITENDIGELKNTGEDGKPALSALSINEVAAQAFVFFIAGFETSSTASTFCLFELVQNPEIQEKARKEINAVLEKHDGKITYDSLMEMTYLDQCINETLRKYPPVPVHSRHCTKTYKVPNSDLVLPKDSFVFIPVMGIQYDPEIYPDPEKFDPERFSPENKASRHSAAWTPFGDGPRVCIGLRFGLMQTKVALTTLLTNYRFTLNPKTKTPINMDPKGFILTAEDGIWLDAEKI